MIPLFPEFAPDPVQKRPPPKLSKKCEMVLAALRTLRQADSFAIAAHLCGEVVQSQVEDHLDTLVKRGLVADTGGRTRWTSKGRAWVWRVVDQESEAAS